MSAHANWAKRDRAAFSREAARLVALLTAAARAVTHPAGEDPSEDIAAAVKAAHAFAEEWDACPCIDCQSEPMRAALAASVGGAS